MKNSPLVSVLMPVYNGERYLSEAIESVLSQTYTHFELIICNDGSTDKSEEIILSYKDERIRYVKNENNIKLIATLNKCIDLAKGKYIARMDADDISLPNRLYQQIQFLEKHTDYVLCGSWAYLMNDNGERTGRIKNIDSHSLIKTALFFTCSIIHPTVVCKTEVMKQFKYNVNALHCEDFDLWVRMANSGLKMINLPQFLINYRWHRTNISNVNSDYQLQQKKEILRPDIEIFLNRTISDYELDLHFYSFQLYQFSQKKELEFDLNEEKKWFLYLIKQNKLQKKFQQSDFIAFVWSRWIVCCVYNRKKWNSFIINIQWYNPIVFIKALKLLLYK